MAKKGKSSPPPAVTQAPDLVTNHPNPLAGFLPLIDRAEEFLENPKLNAEERQELGFIGTLVEGVFALSAPDPDRVMKGRVALTEVLANGLDDLANGVDGVRLEHFGNPVEIAEFTSVVARRADTAIRARVERLMEELGNGSPDPYIAARQERHLRGQIAALGALNERLNGAQNQAFASAEEYLRGESESTMSGFALAITMPSRKEEGRVLAGARNSAAEVGQWAKRLENAKAGRAVILPPAEDAPDTPRLPHPSMLRLPEDPVKKKLVQGVDCSWTNGFSLRDCPSANAEKPGPEAPTTLPNRGPQKDSGRPR